MISLSLVASLGASLYSVQCTLISPEEAVEPRLHDPPLPGGLPESQPLIWTLILPEETVEPRLHDPPSS